MESKAAASRPDSASSGSSPALRPALLAELATLGSLATATGRARTSGGIAVAAVEILCRATDATAGLILFNAGEDYTVGAHHGLRPEHVDLIAGFHRVGARLTAALEATEAPLFGAVTDAPLRPEIVAALQADGVGYALLVGLRAAGELIGVLGLGWGAPPVNRPIDAVMLQAATLVAVGLENARLVERLEKALDSERRLAEEQGALQSLTLIAERTQTFEELADRTIRQVAGVVGAVGAAYGVVTDDTLQYHAAVGVPPDVLTVVTGPRGVEMIRRTAGHGALLQAYEPGAASDWTLSIAAREGWTAFAIVPIRVENRLEALLALYFDRPIADLRLGQRELERIGSIVSISLANFRLRSRLEQAVAAERTLTEEQATLTALTLVADAAPELGQLAATTLNQIVTYLGAAAGAYALVGDDDQLAHIAHVGVDAGWIANVKGVPASSMTPVQRLAAGSGPYLQPYVEGGAKPINLERARARGHTAYAALPIRVDDKFAGLITVWFTRPVETIAWHERAVNAMARIAGFSLANFRLRERLSASESLYRTLFESAPDAVILLSSGNEVVAANRAALELYRTDFDSLRAFAGTDGQVDPAERRRRSEILARDGRASFRDTGRRPDGSEFPEQVDIAQVAFSGEQQWLVLVRDLTEQDRFQRELLQAQKMEAIGQLVSGVAHELNNPLASIIAFSQLIQRDERLPQDLRADAELLTQEADRTRRIVQNLLDFARRRPPERVPTSTRALVDSVLALQSYSLASGRIAVEVDIPADLPTIDVDRSQLQQVLLNLTLNAIQAIRSGGSAGPAGPAGTIRISARQVETDGAPAVRIAITDDGPGVPPESRSGLFVPFFTTKEPGEGTGLGLPVSFGIIAAHGGHLWYEPGPGDVGATFAFELPVRAVAALATADAVGLDRAEGTASTATPGRDDAGQPSDRTTTPAVLVLDDEPSIRAFLTKALKLGHFEPTVAQRGVEALELVRQRTFDAVLVDHRMPGMSGTDVYEAAVAIRPELAPRFVFMSGDVLNPDLREFAEQRDVSLLAKPFDVETVLRVVADVVAQGRSRG